LSRDICICRISGGELFERVINDDFILTEKACIMFMRQICEGIEFMHNNSILHLDLKVGGTENREMNCNLEIST